MYLIYDCEIISCIPERDGTRFSGFRYCDGWHDHDSMGISVIGCKWRDDDAPFACFSAQEFERVRNQRNVKLIGFNSRSFDDALLAANGVFLTTDYDLLEAIRIAAYGSPYWQDQPNGYSYSLGAIAKANGLEKTGSGALAPQLWQQGKTQEVVDYCLNDVVITEKILQLGLKGKLIDPNTDEFLKLQPLTD